MKIVSPPKIELIMSFNIFLKGTINILPNKKMKHIQAKKVITLISISFSPNDNYFLLPFVCFNLDKYYYPTSSSDSKYEYFLSLIISTWIPFDLANFIK